MFTTTGAAGDDVPSDGILIVLEAGQQQAEMNPAQAGESLG